MSAWLILFIAVDVVITVLVIVLILRRHTQLGASLPGSGSTAGFGDLMAFTREHHVRIGEFLRAQWSGAPEQLPAALTSLLGEMEQNALTRGLTVDRDTLKAVLASSIRSHRLARNRDVEGALRQVA